MAKYQSKMRIRNAKVKHEAAFVARGMLQRAAIIATCKKAAAEAKHPTAHAQS